VKTISTLNKAVEDFLTHKRIAVAGVSRSGSEASNLIYRNYATQALKCLRLIRTRMFNPQDEMLGEEQVKVLFEETGAHSPEEIIARLKKAGEVWANGRAQQDDVTFVVVKSNNN